MFFCPTCQKEFMEEEKLVKHMSKCWREKNPSHKSKPAPRGEDCVTRKMSNDAQDFFNSFIKEDVK